MLSQELVRSDRRRVVVVVVVVALFHLFRELQVHLVAVSWQLHPIRVGHCVFLLVYVRRIPVELKLYLGLLLTNVNIENAPMQLCSLVSLFVFGVSRRSSMFSLLHTKLGAQRLAKIKSADDTRAAAAVSTSTS